MRTSIRWVARLAVLGSLWVIGCGGDDGSGGPSAGAAQGTGGASTGGGAGHGGSAGSHGGGAGSQGAGVGTGGNSGGSGGGAIDAGIGGMAGGSVGPDGSASDSGSNSADASDAGFETSVDDAMSSDVSLGSDATPDAGALPDVSADGTPDVSVETGNGSDGEGADASVDSSGADDGSGDETTPEAGCATGLVLCGQTCVNTDSDNANCGSCGAACTGGKLCSGSNCQCPQNQTDCGGTCVNTSSDNSNCGACGTTCSGGKVCSGTCQCPQGKTDCGGTCVDTTSDPSHCGGCPTVCGPNQVCNSSNCTTQCATGLTDCGGACVDTKTNSNHCNGCNNACTGGKICTNSACACPTGLIDCGGTCVDPREDSNNCNGCGNVCPGSSFCDNATCSCDPGWALCGSDCVYTKGDPNNCGTCGKTCTGGSVCSNSQCVCAPPLVDCGGKCVSTQSDPQNCGACGSTCTGGTCIAGGCVCPLYQSLCGGKCIPTGGDPANCGGCNVVCDPGKVCQNGTCTTSCTGGLTSCNGACVNVSTDNSNCGTCGHACGPTTACAGGSCVSTNPPPAKCQNGGPPVVLVGGSAPICSGDTAATTFPWAICTCNGFTGQGSQTFDAFDSSKAPYTPGGLGAGVGANGSYSGGSSMSCTGDLWSFQGINPGNATVSQGVHSGGSLGGSVTVSHNGYIVGPFSGSGSFGGNLYTPTCPAPGGYTVSGSCVASPGLVVPPPCSRCAQADQVPVQTYVTHYANPANNDDAAIGLSPSRFDNGGSTSVLVLPCGYYYLNRIVATQGITIVAHGNTALFVGGSIDISGSLVLDLDPTSRFDLFVAGDIYGNGTLNVGQPAYPANMRVYVGGTCKATSASCSSNGECCSATCTNGTCAGASILPNDPPWSIYMKASANIAADLYAPNGEIYASASFNMYGAIFASYYHGKASTTIHYDTASVKQGTGCPPPPPGCTSCLDCGNQACINGSCGACTSDAQCCPPLICSNGTCILPTRP